MAIEVTAFNIVPTLFGFSGLDQADRTNSEVPRQELRFSLQGEILPVPGLGDNQGVQVVTDLPTGFAYILIEAEMNIAVTTGNTNNWENQFSGSVVDSSVGAFRTYERQFEMTCQGAQIAGPQTGLANRTWSAKQLPTLTIIPIPGQQSNVSWFNVNSTINDVACRLNFMARFLMYDVNQAHHYAVNTPTLTR